jgi:hypothetical protein
MGDGLTHFFNDLKDFDVQMSHIFNSSPLRLEKKNNFITAVNVGHNDLSLGIQPSYLSGVDDQLEDNEIRLFSGETSMYNYTSGKKAEKTEDKGVPDSPSYYTITDHYLTANNNENIIRRLYQWLRKNIKDAVVTIPAGTILYRTVSRDNAEQLNALNANFDAYKIDNSELKAAKNGMYFNLIPFCNMSIAVATGPIDAVIMYETTKDIFLLNTFPLTRLLQHQLKSGSLDDGVRGYSKRLDEATTSKILKEMGLNGQISTDVAEEISERHSSNYSSNILIPGNGKHSVNEDKLAEIYKTLDEKSDNNIIPAFRYTQDDKTHKIYPARKYQPLELYICSEEYGECFKPYILPKKFDNKYRLQVNNPDKYFGPSGSRKGQKYWWSKSAPQPSTEFNAAKQQKFTDWMKIFSNDWHETCNELYEINNENKYLVENTSDIFTIYDLNIYNDNEFIKWTMGDDNPKSGIVRGVLKDENRVDMINETSNFLRDNYIICQSIRYFYYPLLFNDKNNSILLKKLRNEFCSTSYCLDEEDEKIKNDSIIDEKEFKSGDDLKEWFTENFYKNDILNRKIKEFTGIFYKDVINFENYNIPAIVSKVYNNFEPLRKNDFEPLRINEMDIISYSDYPPENNKKVMESDGGSRTCHITYIPDKDKDIKDTDGNKIECNCNIADSIIKIILTNLDKNNIVKEDRTEEINTLINKLLYINATTSGDYNQLSYKNMMVNENEVTNECIPNPLDFLETDNKGISIEKDIVSSDKIYPPAILKKFNENVTKDNPIVYCNKTLQDIDKLLNNINKIHFMTFPTYGVKNDQGDKKTDEITPLAHWIKQSKDENFKDISEIRIQNVEQLIYVLLWELGYLSDNSSRRNWKKGPKIENYYKMTEPAYQGQGNTYYKMRKTNLEDYDEPGSFKKTTIFDKRLESFKDTEDYKYIINRLDEHINDAIDDKYISSQGIKIAINIFIGILLKQVREISYFFVRMYLKGGTAFKLLFQKESLTSDNDVNNVKNKILKALLGLSDDEISKLDYRGKKNKLDKFLAKQLGENSDYDLIMTCNPWLSEIEYNDLYKSCEKDCYYILKKYLTHDISTRYGLSAKLIKYTLDLENNGGLDPDFIKSLDISSSAGDEIFKNEYIITYPFRHRIERDSESTYKVVDCVCDSWDDINPGNLLFGNNIQNTMKAEYSEVVTTSGTMVKPYISQGDTRDGLSNNIPFTNITEILESKTSKFHIDDEYQFFAKLKLYKYSLLSEIDSRDKLNKKKIPRQNPNNDYANIVKKRPTKEGKEDKLIDFSHPNGAILSGNGYLSQNDLTFKDTEAGVWKMTTEFGLMRFMLKYPLTNILRHDIDKNSDDNHLNWVLVPVLANSIETFGSSLQVIPMTLGEQKLYFFVIDLNLKGIFKPEGFPIKFVITTNSEFKKYNVSKYLNIKTYPSIEEWGVATDNAHLKDIKIEIKKHGSDDDSFIFRYKDYEYRIMKQFDILQVDIEDNDELQGIVEIIDISFVKYSGRERVQKWNDSENLDIVSISNELNNKDHKWKIINDKYDINQDIPYEFVDNTSVEIPCYPLDICIKDIQETIEDNILSGRTRKLQKRKKREEILLYMATLVKLSKNEYEHIKKPLRKYLSLVNDIDDAVIVEESENYIKSTLNFTNIRDYLIIDVDNKTKASFLLNTYLKINTGHVNSPEFLPWNITDRCLHFIKCFGYILIWNYFDPHKDGTDGPGQQVYDYYDQINNVKSTKDIRNWYSNIGNETSRLIQSSLQAPIIIQNFVENIERLKQNTEINSNDLDIFMANLVLYIINYMDVKLNIMGIKEMYSIVFIHTLAIVNKIIELSYSHNKPYYLHIIYPHKTSTKVKNSLWRVFNKELGKYFTKFIITYYERYDYSKHLLSGKILGNYPDKSDLWNPRTHQFNDPMFGKILYQKIIISKLLIYFTEEGYKPKVILYGKSTDNYYNCFTNEFWNKVGDLAMRGKYFPTLDLPQISIGFEDVINEFDYNKIINDTLGRTYEDRFHKLNEIIQSVSGKTPPDANSHENHYWWEKNGNLYGTINGYDPNYGLPFGRIVVPGTDPVRQSIQIEKDFSSDDDIFTFSFRESFIEFYKDRAGAHDFQELHFLANEGSELFADIFKQQISFTFLEINLSYNRKIHENLTEITENTPSITFTTNGVDIKKNLIGINSEALANLATKVTNGTAPANFDSIISYINTNLSNQEIYVSDYLVNNNNNFESFYKTLNVATNMEDISINKNNNDEIIKYKAQLEAEEKAEAQAEAEEQQKLWALQQLAIQIHNHFQPSEPGVTPQIAYNYIKSTKGNVDAAVSLINQEILKGQQQLAAHQAQQLAAHQAQQLAAHQAQQLGAHQAQQLAAHQAQQLAAHQAHQLAAHQAQQLAAHQAQQLAAQQLAAHQAHSPWGNPDGTWFEHHFSKSQQQQGMGGFEHHFSKSQQQQGMGGVGHVSQFLQGGGKKEKKSNTKNKKSKKLKRKNKKSKKLKRKTIKNKLPSKNKKSKRKNKNLTRRR